MKYVILQTTKLKTVAIIEASAKSTFAGRHSSKPTVMFGATGPSELVEALKRRLDIVPLVRKNAVLLIEYLFSASLEWFLDNHHDQHDAYFSSSYRWLTASHGSENVLSFIKICDDGKTPLARAYVVPIDVKGRLNASYFLDGRLALSVMQTEFAEKCGRPFGLERGTEGFFAHQVNNLSLANDLSDRSHKAHFAPNTNGPVISPDHVAHLRALPLEEVLKHFGALVSKKDRKNWITRAGRLTVNGNKFYNHDAKKGGGGAIDLVMHIEDLDYKSALRRLVDVFGGGPIISEMCFRSKEVVDNIIKTSAEPYQLPEKIPAYWAGVRHYLTSVRGLDGRLIDGFHANGSIYADKFKNAVFVLGKNEGVELRGTGETKFHGVRGKKCPFIIDRSSEDAHVAFVESTIDALSLRQLGFAGMIVATIGNSAETLKNYLLEMQEKGLIPIAAFDADNAGDSMSRNMGNFQRLRPKYGKDWNDDLRFIACNNVLNNVL